MGNSDLVADLRGRIAFPDGHADVWPLFYDAELFGRVLDALAEPLAQRITKIAGIESRGFLLGAAVAARLQVGFVAIRKQQGLFPGPKLTETTGADYRGTGHVLRLQEDSCGPADVVAIVDDWFETGSQASAAKTLIKRARRAVCRREHRLDQLKPSVRELLAPCHSLIDADLLG